MAVRLCSNLFSRKPFQNVPELPTHPFFFSYHSRIKISCSKNSNDAELALEFATEAAKLNTHEVQREEAFKKSKLLLFNELCDYMGLEADDVKRKWCRMSEDDKVVLVKGFVSNWGSHFHPLSARSVKELVDEYLLQDIPCSSSHSSTPKLFPVLKRLLGFPQD